MTDMRRSRPFDRSLVIGSVLLLAIVLVGFFVHTCSLYVELEHGVFTTDPRTGALVEHIPRDQRAQAFGRVVDARSILRPANGLGLVGLVFVALGLWRLGGRSGDPLGFVAVPVLLPVAIGLLAGAFSHFSFDGGHEQIFETLTGRLLASTGGCLPMLTPCSHIQAIEWISTITIAITCVCTASAFVFAARRVWLLGERGTTTTKGWVFGALALFGVGALALVASMPYANDHARAARQCTDEPGSAIPGPSLDLHGRLVESCGPDPLAGYDQALTGVEVQVSAEGRVSDFSRGSRYQSITAGEFADQSRIGVEKIARTSDLREEPQPNAVAVVLHVDERTPALAIRDHLRAAQADGVTAVVLLGEVHVERSLESVGSWIRRDSCPIGWIRLRHSNEDVESLGDFSTWGEILAVAHELGTEGMDLVP